MANGEIVLLNPPEELGDINAVAADRQTASVLAGEIGEELLHGLLKNVMCRSHGHTVANLILSGQTRNLQKYGSYNTCAGHLR